MDFISVTEPTAFLLLLLIPIFVRLGWPQTAYRRRRDFMAMGIRIALIVVLILSLAGLQARQRANRLAVVFLVDVSDSMDSVSQAQAIEYVQAAVANMTTDDQAAIILFGENALVEQPMQDIIDIRQLGTRPVAINTDLAEAIRLGLALFPPDAAKRIVILSDGLETTGNALRAAELAAATDVQIDYVPFGIVRDREVLVSSVRVPSVVGEDEPFDMIVEIENRGNVSTQVLLNVSADGETLEAQEVTVRPGTNRYVFSPLQYPTARFINFRVTIEPQTGEGFTENNQLSAFTQVTGRSRVLIVASDPTETTALEAALTDAGLLLEVIQPDQMPLGLAPLAVYESIILANVSAAELTPLRMELLQLYVRDAGRGLVVIGGPDSFGVGGYFDTPLEETLPVDMRIRDQERIPQLTMVYVLDRSGSMEFRGTSGFSNLQLAKEAIIRSVNFLNDYDRTGIVSFDTQAFWVVDIQNIGSSSNRNDIIDLVASLNAGGGTDIYGGMSAIDRELPGDPSTLKHVILLTDGGANPEGVIPLTGRLRDSYDITTTVIAVGQDYAPWLRDMARVGGGNFHIATTVENIPAIFSSETVLATRSYIYEEPFRPALTATSPIVDGISLSSIPNLLGYIATSPKDTATVIFTGPEDDPILASWQYGLGRSVAFTSDATLRWGTEWVTNWGDYTKFWNQVVRWTITENSGSNIDTRIETRGDTRVVVVDARDDAGNYLNQLDLDTAIIYPDRTTQSPTFRQVAPGRYEAAFQPNQEGSYFIRVYGTTPEDAPIEATVAQNTGWVLSYSQEYSVSEPAPQFLQDIAVTTGGGSLAGNPANAFVHNLNQAEAALPLYPYLLALAAFLLILDIAVRRLVINRSDVERLRAWAAGLVGRSPSTYEGTDKEQRISDLMRAKQRASGEPQPQTAVPTVPSAAPVSKPAATNPPPSAGPVQRPARQTNTRGEASATTASSLLKKKRERDDA